MASPSYSELDMNSVIVIDWISGKILDTTVLVTFLSSSSIVYSWNITGQSQVFHDLYISVPNSWPCSVDFMCQIWSQDSVRSIAKNNTSKLYIPCCHWFSTHRQAPNTLMWQVSMTSGPRLNIKTVLSTYGDFHVKDKTAVRTSYLLHGNRHTW